MDKYPLPPIPLPPQCMRGPTDSSNWVIKDLILCGEYPGSKDEATHFSILNTYSYAGITTFVCLQQDKELRHFRPYINDYSNLCSKQAGVPINSTLLRFPIEDGCEADDDVALLQFVHDLIERVEAGAKIFIHCWAGRGRTGIIVACLLGILYSLPALEALRRTNMYYNQRAQCFGDSPEYFPQKQQVIRVLKLHAHQQSGTDSSQPTASEGN